MFIRQTGSGKITGLANGNAVGEKKVEVERKQASHRQDLARSITSRLTAFLTAIGPLSSTLTTVTM